MTESQVLTTILEGRICRAVEILRAGEQAYARFLADDAMPHLDAAIQQSDAVQDALRALGEQPIVDLAELGEQLRETRACRVCGCTQEAACPGGCSWAEWDLCSRCVAQAAEATS